jgi:hypothetical protein
VEIRARLAFSSKMEGSGMDQCNLGLSDDLFCNQATNLAQAQMTTSSLKPSRNPADSYLGAGLAASEHSHPHCDARSRKSARCRRGV